jgi:hypothetical protein
MTEYDLFRRAAEILDDFIPTCRQHGDNYVGVRETKDAVKISQHRRYGFLLSFHQHLFDFLRCL